MEAFKGRFRLNGFSRGASPPSSRSPSPPPSSPNPSQFQYFRAFSDPTTPAAAIGSFQFDSTSKNYPYRWESWSEFQTWRANEERQNCIELRLVTTFLGLPEYERQCRYVCSRGGTGGVKAYEKLHPEWNRKREPKRTHCKCVLTVKQYPGVDIVLGSYTSDHNHATGNANLPFVQIPKETREYIAGLLRQKIDPAHIVSLRSILVLAHAYIVSAAQDHSRWHLRP